MKTLSLVLTNFMKFLAISMFLALMAKAFLDIFSGCADNNFVIVEKKTMYQIDSVDFHPIGRDHTAQIDQYWKLRLKGTDKFIHAYRPYSVGDSIIITERFYRKK